MRRAARSIGVQIMLVSGLVVLGTLGLTVAYVLHQSIPQERIEQVAAAGEGQVFVEAGDVVAGVVVLGVLGVVFAGIVTIVIARRAVQPLGEALRRQRQFVADASHELRTPLSVLDARLQALQRRVASGSVSADDSVTADIARLRDDSRALVDIVGDLLIAAEGATDDSHTSTVDDVAAEVIDSLHVLADDAEVTFSLAREPEALVALPATTLRRCVLALVDNALVHSPEGGEIHLEVSVTRAGKKRSASLAVTDQGAGIQGIDPARIFDRFAHAAPRQDGPAARQGFGIGLALVKDVATRHGGDVTVAASSSAGSTLVLTLPLRPREDIGR